MKDEAILLVMLHKDAVCVQVASGLDAEGLEELAAVVLGYCIQGGACAARVLEATERMQFGRAVRIPAPVVLSGANG